ncbi:protein of unknown function [Shinella sp. WSC3-e]|nr:hypothetical protein SHINE37_40288 [Rhizobiaceae bacterium]CAK7254972.1 protein of unknown function [Shinella sp. WSC3-e]
MASGGDVLSVARSGNRSMLRPLWPAGHPPSRGEISKTRGIAFSAAFVMGETVLHPISPLEGEMAGRPEGGMPP